MTFASRIPVRAASSASLSDSVLQEAGASFEGKTWEIGEFLPRFFVFGPVAESGSCQIITVR